jgi:2-polyprenyl-3-methyl-5-hydroxy-6-metoxy-1,4-benzoquinol methylase
MQFRSTCPVCTSTKLTGVTERPNVPVHQNKLYDTRADARAARRGHLKIVACLTCGFVFNAAFDLSLMSYNEGYENDQTHSPAFSAHVDKLLDHLLNTSDVRNSRIVEVGCGKGTFLKRLIEADAGNVGWGFDPAYTGPETDVEGRLEFIRTFYDRQYAHLAPDVVVCRHVIEHVPEPAMLLSAIRQDSTSARVFVETPDVEWILRNEVIWDLFYEHCSYFSPFSFATAFQRAGFESVTCARIFGGQYLWVEARGGRKGTRTVTSDPGDIAKLVDNYVRRESEVRLQWSDTVQSLHMKGAVALWGAGAKGVTSASLFDPDTTLISCVVDLNPAKQNRFIAGSGHPIVPPSALQRLGVKNVVLMNPNYKEEVEQLLKEAKIDVNLIVEPRVS